MENENYVKLAEALAKAQGEIQTPKKNQKVSFAGRNYGYADLASVLDAIREPLTKNGLSVVHKMGNFEGQFGMRTILMHSSGEKIDTWYPLPDPSRIKAQEFGSALTYARRYSISALIGIASEDDDDGAAAPPPPPEQKKQDKKAVPKPPPKDKTKNHTPANQGLIDTINGLCAEKQIPEGSLNYLITKGYQEKIGSVKTWVAEEIVKLLSLEDASEAKVIAYAEKRISHLQAQQINGGQS